MGISPAFADSFGVELWPNGSVPYKYDTGGNDGTYYTMPFSVTDQGLVEQEMLNWMNAMEVADPNGGGITRYIRFWECTNNCPTNGYVLVRYNKKRVSDNTPSETNNMGSYFEGNTEKVGRNPNPGGRTEYHLIQGDDGKHATSRDTHDGNTSQDPNTIRHELGHCLGLWHEFNREDADRWLVETPDLDGTAFSRRPTRDDPTGFFTKAELMPVLGNYDYDSLMHYSFDNVTDRKGNRFGRTNLDRDPDPGYVSERDVSRVHQYYAYERYRGWGFFTSLSRESQQDPDAYPNPYLAQGVKAVGTPAIAHQSSGNYDIFTRGSDDQIYCKNNTASEWQAIACCFSSDPSAVSRAPGRIDVVAISNTVSNRGEVQRIKYIDGTWYAR